MVYFTLIVLLLIQAYSWIVYKDFLCPAVIHNIFWILSIFGFLFLVPGVDISFNTSILIIVGAIAFQVGYSIIRTNKTVIVSEVIIKVSPIKWFVLLLLLPFTYVMMRLFSLGHFSIATIYESLTEGKEDLGIPEYYNYIFKFIQFFSLAILVLYWKTNKKNRPRGLTKWIIVLFVMGLACVLSSPTRNGLMFFFAPLIMIYLFTHQLSKKKILLFLLVSMMVFMFYFYFVSLNKYWYNYESGDSPMSVLGGEILSYLSGSIYALDISMSQHAFTRGGADTFRFLIAIYDSIFHTSYTPDIVNEYVSGKVTTNVYTFYDYYIRDFGMAYAIFIQFIFAMLHAYSYKSSKRGSLFYTAFAAMLSYPLLMQFFQDQYLSLTSLWVQALIVLIIVFRTRIFYHTYRVAR